jgi:PEP-CTERM motif
MKAPSIGANTPGLGRYSRRPLGRSKPSAAQRAGENSGQPEPLCAANCAMHHGSGTQAKVWAAKSYELALGLLTMGPSRDVWSGSSQPQHWNDNMNATTATHPTPTSAARAPRFAIKAAAVLAGLCLSAAASAGTVTLSGDTTAAPTWNRTLTGTPPTQLSGVGTAVRYVVNPFQVSANGGYSLLNESAYDNYLTLYTTAFNPLAQFANVMAADDDAGAGTNALINFNLTSGVTYFAVASGFENTDFGAYRLTIQGPGDILVPGPTGGNVPEPTSLALAGVALLGLAATGRRKSA